MPHRPLRCSWHLLGLISLLTAASATKVAAAEPPDADPAVVTADPDYRLQGEYVDSKRGMQVIARGDEEFDVVIYNGGLPGAGWDRGDRQQLEVDIDDLETMLEQFDRVDRKSPSLGAKPPSGAVVLFDGTKETLEAQWKQGAKMTDEGLLMQGCTSKDTFGDYSLHLEFRLPYQPTASGQARGNSGVYHQGRFETQVLDSFGLDGKENECGGIYSIRAPDLNACLPPMVWQTYDVDFTAARFGEDGEKLSNAKMTVKLNGIVIHRDVELPHATTAAPLADGPEDGPIYLQDHGNPVRYRNIWVLPRDLEAEAKRPRVAAFERFHSTGGDLVDGGRLLLAELNCVACHASEAFSATFSPKQAPILDKVGSRVRPEWMLAYLTDPHGTKPGTTMPDVLAWMSDEQRKQAATALTHFLVGNDVVISGGKGANTKEGEKLFHESGCVVCHLPRDGRKASEATSVSLVGIENKYTRASLEAFLRDPLAVRPSGRMPRIDLGGDNWRHVAQYLTGDMEVSVGADKNLPKEANTTFEAYNVAVNRLPDFNQLTPDATGISRGFDISAGKRDTHVALRFFGDLPIKTPGAYRFRMMSDDGSRLYIDDQLVIDNDGIHGETTKQGAIRLDEGIHKVRVEWFEFEGGEALAVEWSGPGVDPGRLDHAIVPSDKSAEALANMKAVEVDPEEFIYDPTQALIGRQMFSTLGCAACHERHADGKRLTSTTRAPELAKVDAQKGCLGEDRTGVPNFDLTPRQVESIVAAIPASAEVRVQPSPVHLMKASNCYACHKRDQLGGAESDRNAFFVSTIPEMGDEGRLAPPLDGVGDKLRRDWIKSVVSGGNKSRPYMKTHMPGFGGATAETLASQFAEIDQRTEANIVTTDEPASRRVSLGRKMVGSKGLACVSCHTFGKFKSTGIQAIALDTMAQRIREDWFHRYLPNPQAYRPGTRMPNGYPEGKSTVTDIYDGDQAKQLAAMWAFLEKGTGGGVPEGIVGGMIELKPTDKPVLYRNFIDGVSPRGIAVGYPEKANLCWDAEGMSLALVWQDRFLDASKHWVGRGPGNQTPLGGGIIKLEKVSPIALLSSESEPFPDQSGRDLGYRFLGYRLDGSGRPTFRYETEFATVEDFPMPIPGEYSGNFRRSIRVDLKGNRPDGTVYFRAAVGKVEPESGGGFSINGEYVVRIEGGGQPRVRSVGGNSELLVPIEESSTIIQDIIW